VKLWGSYAFEGLMYWLSRFFKRSLAGALTLKRYCRMRLAEENRYLFIPSSLDVKLEVDEAFVTLTLDHQGGKGVNYDHRDILTVGNRIRVIGDPESGKSSLVKRLFRDACYQALRKPSQARLPFLVELKNLSVPGKQPPEKLGEWFVKKLREVANKSKVYQMEECFDTYAENTGLFVLLDGLDEVSTSDYARVQSAIIGLSQRLSQMSERSIIVLTMWTQFHQQGSVP
jgi:predicted NACHT family NTPase